MPYLKAILVNATVKSNRMLRAKSMECISLVRMAVGKEKFRDDAKQEMRNVCFVFQNLQSPMQSRQASMAGGFIGFLNNYSSNFKFNQPSTSATSEDKSPVLYRIKLDRKCRT
ncbi:hypothetical protein V6N13_132876 [Hibiscus sabdariffa]